MCFFGFYTSLIIYPEIKATEVPLQSSVAFISAIDNETKLVESKETHCSIAKAREALIKMV